MKQKELRTLDESTRRLLAEDARRKRWRGRDARAEPFRPVDEITEAAQRHGWTVIALDEKET